MFCDFSHAPRLGAGVTYKGQFYCVTAVEPYTRKDGEQSFLLTWATKCPSCHKPFEIRTGLRLQSPTRRCMKHRKRGVFVPPAAQQPSVFD